MFDKSFIDSCLTGDALLDDIEDYIEYWHENDSDLELNEFLGMTPDEYAEWIKTGEDMVLRDIIEARNVSIPYCNYATMTPDVRMAARSYKRNVVEEIKNRRNVAQ